MNLLDYLDKPEMLRHIEGAAVTRAVDLGEEFSPRRVLLVFKDGLFGRYKVDSPSIIPKTRLKRQVRGYRKAVLFSNGAVDAAPMYYPTKEEFKDQWKSEKLIGEWQEILYEIEEDCYGKSYTV